MNFVLMIETLFAPPIAIEPERRLLYMFLFQAPIGGWQEGTPLAVGSRKKKKKSSRGVGSACRRKMRSTSVTRKLALERQTRVQCELGFAPHLDKTTAFHLS